MMLATSQSEALAVSKERQIRIAARIKIPPRISLKTRRRNFVNSNKWRVRARGEASPLVTDVQRYAGGNSSAGQGTQL
jgi:hypothetical protein